MGVGGGWREAGTNRIKGKEQSKGFTTCNEELVSRIYKEAVQSNFEKANKSKEKMRTEYND